MPKYIVFIVFFDSHPFSAKVKDGLPTRGLFERIQRSTDLKLNYFLAYAVCERADLRPSRKYGCE